MRWAGWASAVAVVACVLLSAADGPVQRTGRPVGTMTADLLALNDWLNAHEVEPGARERTGVSWRPVCTRLEADHPILVVSAQHLQRVPGRTTDVKDSAWLADRLRHGLLHARLIPPQPMRARRELTRERTTLVQERQQEANRRHKVRERATLKLGAVASDVLGTSGRARARRRCWRRCWPASRTPTSWPRWRAGGCGPSCRRCAWGGVTREDFRENNVPAATTRWSDGNALVGDGNRLELDALGVGVASAWGGGVGGPPLDAAGACPLDGAAESERPE